VGVLRYVTGLASAPVEVLFGRVRQWVLDLPVVDLPQGRQLRVVWDSELAMPVSRVLGGVAVAEPGAMGNLIGDVLEVVSRHVMRLRLEAGVFDLDGLPGEFDAAARLIGGVGVSVRWGKARHEAAKSLLELSEPDEREDLRVDAKQLLIKRLAPRLRQRLDLTDGADAAKGQVEVYGLPAVDVLAAAIRPHLSATRPMVINEPIERLVAELAEALVPTHVAGMPELPGRGKRLPDLPGTSAQKPYSYVTEDGAALFPMGDARAAITRASSGDSIALLVGVDEDGHPVTRSPTRAGGGTTETMLLDRVGNGTLFCLTSSLGWMRSEAVVRSIWS
jgi:hypothetical protein